MIKKKDPELIDVSLPKSFSKDIIPIQDKLNIDLNQQIISSIISKKENDFIIKTNKSFYHEFGKLYSKNILLKTKLNELLKEKKSLSQIIIKKEQQIKKEKRTIKEENDVIEENNNKININSLQYYRKKKRIRRKKKEINYVYNCYFPNCNKKYPTKGSLNMHIKLKHQKNMLYNYIKEDYK